MISTPEFRYIERHALEKWVGQGFDIRQLNTRFSRLTQSAIENVGDSYDLVLFDCPPGMSMFAEAAIELSEFIVIPTIPDYVSRLGIFAFRKRAIRSMEQRRFTEDRIWTLITKYEDRNTLHRSDQNKSDHPRWSMICCYNAARNDPYKDSHHPRYTPLNVVSDSSIQEVGIKRFAESSDVAWLDDNKDRSTKLLEQG